MTDKGMILIEANRPELGLPHLICSICNWNDPNCVENAVKVLRFSRATDAIGNYYGPHRG